MSTARAIIALLLLGVIAGTAAASPGSRPNILPDPRPTPKPVSASIGARAVAIAKQYLGVPYVYAGATPKGFDCSGFTMYVYAQLGIFLNHYSGDQFHEGYRVLRSQLKPGDLVFFYGKKEPEHVGMYIGGGQFIHAPHTGDVVKISPLAGHYTKVWSGAVRPYGLGPPIIFPVVGAKATYTNTFSSTPKGLLPGNDIIAPKKSLVVAAENGTVKIYTKSKEAGCMLYLFGVSGRTFEYLHLNNDMTSRNDNTGKCVAGTAYAPGVKTGQKVKAGQVIGYVGDSGLANGTQAHVHFEVHKSGPVNPYPYLNKSQRLMYAVLPGGSSTVTVDGDVVSATATTLTFAVSTIHVSPGNLVFKNVNRNLTVSVAADADIELAGPDLASTGMIKTTLGSAEAGQGVSIRTTPGPATLNQLLGKKSALEAFEVILSAMP